MRLEPIVCLTGGKRAGPGYSARVFTSFIARSSPTSMIRSTASAPRAIRIGSSFRSAAENPSSTWPIVSLLPRWTAHAEPHPDEVLGAEMVDDGLESVVTCRAATQLDAYLAEGDVDLVLHNDQSRRVDLVEPHQLTQRTSRLVHVRGRARESRLVLRENDVSATRVPLLCGFSFAFVLLRSSSITSRSGVMTRVGVSLPGISEAGDNETIVRIGARATEDGHEPVQLLLALGLLRRFRRGSLLGLALCGLLAPGSPSSPTISGASCSTPASASIASNSSSEIGAATRATGRSGSLRIVKLASGARSATRRESPMSSAEMSASIPSGTSVTVQRT